MAFNILFALSSWAVRRTSAEPVHWFHHWLIGIGYVPVLLGYNRAGDPHYILLPR